jgi:hypothetical protein
MHAVHDFFLSLKIISPFIIPRGGLPLLSQTLRRPRLSISFAFIDMPRSDVGQPRYRQFGPYHQLHKQRDTHQP